LVWFESLLTGPFSSIMNQIRTLKQPQNCEIT